MSLGGFTDFMVVVPSAASLEDVGMEFHRWAIFCEQVSGCVILIKFLRRVLLTTQQEIEYAIVADKFGMFMKGLTRDYEKFGGLTVRDHGNCEGGTLVGSRFM